jgi:hypothetical protein
MDIILREIHGWLAVESWKVNKADINLTDGVEGSTGRGAHPAGPGGVSARLWTPGAEAADTAAQRQG